MVITSWRRRQKLSYRIRYLSTNLHGVISNRSLQYWTCMDLLLSWSVYCR